MKTRMGSIITRYKTTKEPGGIKIMNWNYSAKVGDLVRIYDPDHIEGSSFPYSTIGIVIEIGRKSTKGWRIFKILAEGEIMSFDEPFWAAEVLSANL